VTLARQLRVLLAALAVLVFVAVSLAGILSSRRMLEADLAVDAQAAADTLAGRLSADPAAVAELADAAIALHGLRMARVEREGRAAFERVLPPAPPAVPGWFAVLFPVTVADVSAPLGAGGRLVVRAETGAAAGRLWRAAQQALVPAAATALAVLALGLLVVGPLVRPLRRAEAEAAAALAWEPVGDGGDADVPGVQAAIRQLSRRARLLLDGAQGLAATLHSRASRDPLTGLASRRRLVDVLEARRRDPEQPWSGGLLLIRVEGLKGINETFGYAAGDDVLREAARLLEETFGAEPGVLLAHLAGGEFGVFLPCADAGLLSGRVPAAEQALAGLESRLRFPSSLAVFVGSAYFHGQGISALFAGADHSLRRAQWHGIPGLSPEAAASPAEADTSDLAGRRAAAVVALREGGLRLVLQPVLARETRELCHHEAYARIHAADGSEPMGIGELLAAGDPKVVVAVDRGAIAEAFRLLGSGLVQGDLSLNLSAASLGDGGTVEWLEAECRRRPEVAGRIVLEVPDAELPRLQERLAAGLGRLRRLGLRFAIDHFGAGAASFGQLRALGPAYLKIDGSFAARLDRDAETQFFVRATAQIAHGLGIPAYLEAVESEAAWKLLSELQLDGAQGYYLGWPREVGRRR
jgi:diguanylate cyclase (GGDEF)-like protein